MRKFFRDLQSTFYFKIKKARKYIFLFPDNLLVAEYQTSSTYWSIRTIRQILFTKPFSCTDEQHLAKSYLLLPNCANIHFGGKNHKGWRLYFKTERQGEWETKTTAQTVNEVASENSSLLSCTFISTKNSYVQICSDNRIKQREIASK